MKTTSVKIALVTGGSRGMGRDMAIRLAENGNDVVITYNTQEEEARAVVADIKKLGRQAAALQLDAGKIASLDGFVQKLKDVLQKEFGVGTFDYLVHNAGFGILVPSFAQTTEAQFDDLFNVHFKGVFFLTQKLHDLINDYGAIVTVSTALTRITYPGSGAYASMKSAVETLTRYFAKELGARFIRANVVAPGPVATDFNGAHFRETPKTQAVIKSLNALPRIGLADDLGGVVTFLCSADARWVTGQRIEVSGGLAL